MEEITQISRFCLNNLAQLYEDTERYAEAIPFFEQALQINIMVYGEDSSPYAGNLHNLGFLNLVLGNYRDAEPILLKALEIRRLTLGNSHPDVRSSLAALAELYAATSREREALDRMEECISIDEHILSDVFASYSTNQKMEYLATLQNHFNIYLSLIVKAAASIDSAPRRGLLFVLRHKGLSFEAMEIPREVMPINDKQEPLNQFQELIQSRTMLYRDMVAGPKQESLWDYNERIKQYSSQVERLETELTHQIPDISLSQRLQDVTLQEVARCLPDGSALAEFVHLEIFDFSTARTSEKSKWLPPHYLVFILSASDPKRVHMIDLGEAEPMDALVAAFRRSITGDVTLGSSSRDRTIANNHTLDLREEFKTTESSSRHLIPGLKGPYSDTNSGERLRALIFDPLISHIGDCKHLILAPDGQLNLIPFEILPTGDHQLLIAEYQLSYVNTGREIIRFGKPLSLRPSKSLVVADPDYDLGQKDTDNFDESTGFSTQYLPGLVKRLPGTNQEGEEVASHLEAQLLIGKTALSSTLMSCQSPHVLHIATHAYFETEYFPMSSLDIYPSPIYLEDIRDLPMGRLDWFWRRTERSPLLRSCLVLAGFNTWLRGGMPPREAEQGIVTAADILNMDLRNTELVVLSACETGVGEVATNEGVFGLRRAFMLAGARTLVTSLWRVPDQQTQELMSNFYSHLLAGTSRAESLRKAQLAMHAKYPDPFYWGAFVCHGDPGPLSLNLSPGCRD